MLQSFLYVPCKIFRRQALGAEKRYIMHLKYILGELDWMQVV